MESLNLDRTLKEVFPSLDQETFETDVYRKMA